ncbi:MAG: hypothetical protein KatS3mg111_1405 [Pirellulaceae bacterium]|nr:MAG: hypothetical protein KatS3mg111_1405 [Pirellulaceae bacterium]
MPLDLPTAAAAMGETPQESTIVVNVAADGNWYALGQQVDLPQLANLLRRQRMRAAEPVRLRLRTDAQVAYRRVAPILRLAAQEGIGDIAFSVFEERAR